MARVDGLAASAAASAKDGGHGVGDDGAVRVQSSSAAVAVAPSSMELLVVKFVWERLLDMSFSAKTVSIPQFKLFLQCSPERNTISTDAKEIRSSPQLTALG